MSLQGKLPAVSRVKLKGYTLLKFSLMTLSAPKLLAHSGGACWFHQSLLLASHISDAALGIWTLEGGGKNSTNFGKHLIQGLDSRLMAVL